MIPKIIIETKINPETHQHEYRARLDANYCLSLNSGEISTVGDLQSMVEAALKKRLSDAVYGDIMKEMRQIIETCSELKSIKTYCFDHLDQIKKLEKCVNNVMNLCTFE